jgi:hypothetical protein
MDGSFAWASWSASQLSCANRALDSLNHTASEQMTHCTFPCDVNPIFRVGPGSDLTEQSLYPWFFLLRLKVSLSGAWLEG